MSEVKTQGRWAKIKEGRNKRELYSDIDSLLRAELPETRLFIARLFDVFVNRRVRRGEFPGNI